MYLRLPWARLRAPPRSLLNCRNTGSPKKPEGGIIARKPGSQVLDGLVMETAYLPVVSNMPNPTPEQVIENGKAGQMIYAKAGITTAQEGATHESQLEVLQGLAAGKILFIDVVTYPFILDLDKVLVKNPASTFGTYRN